MRLRGKEEKEKMRYDFTAQETMTGALVRSSPINLILNHHLPTLLLSIYKIYYTYLIHQNLMEIKQKLENKPKFHKLYRHSDFQQNLGTKGNPNSTPSNSSPHRLYLPHAFPMLIPREV